MKNIISESGKVGKSNLENKISDIDEINNLLDTIPDGMKDLNSTINKVDIPVYKNIERRESEKIE